MEIYKPKNESKLNEIEESKLSNDTAGLQLSTPNATKDNTAINFTGSVTNNVTETDELADIDPILTIPSGASTIGNPSYSPDHLTTIKGKMITVVNNDSAPHTVTSGIRNSDPRMVNYLIRT